MRERTRHCERREAVLVKLGVSKESRWWKNGRPRSEMLLLGLIGKY